MVRDERGNTMPSYLEQRGKAWEHDSFCKLTIHHRVDWSSGYSCTYVRNTILWL